MARKDSTRLNLQRQALACALLKSFSTEGVGKLLGMKPHQVTTLVAYRFKSAQPDHVAQELSSAVGAIFESALAAGERAVIQALREAADALERGQQAKLDKEL